MMSSAMQPAHHGAHLHTSPEDEGAGVMDEDERAMEIAAAQLRLVTDRRLGKQTPEWVRALAAEPSGAYAL
ncbi:hypothetical protein IV500_06000 [Paeniglutamicibacter antarcticus]|uniref:Uncharacterized protein n=1 Tax=Arthrobacter terrae TaxID=2935737 RepID=A0A931CM32_9MICC|nr:hypothetical protein [Arthrobacter terrae]MBG0738975.1 hypothetical protein [Arthrobacter terrae]